MERDDPWPVRGVTRTDRFRHGSATRVSGADRRPEGRAAVLSPASPLATPVTGCLESPGERTPPRTGTGGRPDEL